MNDGIIKGDGTSRKMKATLPSTYEEFKQAAGAGEQTLDVMFNSSGWQRQPTFLNKQNLLSDTTATELGFTDLPGATVDQAFLKLLETIMVEVSKSKESTFQKLMTGRLV